MSLRLTFRIIYILLIAVIIFIVLSNAPYVYQYGSIRITTDEPTINFGDM